MADTTIMNPNTGTAIDGVIYYSTTDQNMILALLMFGHRPVKIDPDMRQQLTYHFMKDEVWKTVQGILTNSCEKRFALSDLWEAQNIWTMNLRHYSQRR